MFTIVSAISLLLCIATVALCVRSYSTYDSLSKPVGPLKGRPEDSFRNGYLIESRPATLSISLRHFIAHPNIPGDADWSMYCTTRDPADSPQGFDFMSQEGIGERVWSIMFPHWSLAVFFGILPTYSLIAFIRHRKHRLPGLCPTCGYDLRATPDRCPECGKPRDQRSEIRDQQPTPPV
jgi:hypothetical protein